MIKYILEKVGFVTKILRYAGAFVLFAMMLLTTTDVGGRYLFHEPIMGVFELTEFMLVCVVFFSLAFTQAIKGHVEVDILVGRFPKRVQDAIDIANYLLSFLVLLLITWKSTERGFEIMACKDCSGTLNIPVYPFVFVVALGSAAMSIELLKDLSRKIRELGKS